MRSTPLFPSSYPTTAIAAVFILIIGSALMGAEDSSALALRAARLPSDADVPTHQAAEANPPEPADRNAESTSLRFWRNGGLPDTDMPAQDESQAMTVVVADGRRPSSVTGIARSTSIWRDGGER